MTKKERDKKWWKDHPEKPKEYYQKYKNDEKYKAKKRKAAKKRYRYNPKKFAAYRKKNKKLCNQRTVAWQKSHQKEFKAYQKRYREENKIRERNRQRRWEKENPDKTKAKHSRRRTAKTKAGGAFTAAEWNALCKQYHYKCLRCNRRRKLTADHVIPVSKGGTSNISNIQPLCLSCNSIKGTKSTDYRTRR